MKERRERALIIERTGPGPEAHLLSGELEISMKLTPELGSLHRYGTWECTHSSFLLPFTG